MRTYAMRGGSLQTFSGAQADQRFGRDDVAGDFILRERDLHSHIPLPIRLTQGEPMELSPDSGDDDGEDARDDFALRPNTLKYGY